MTRLARSYVTPALADEVVQETWAAVVGSLDGFEGRSSLKTWVYRILLNKVRNARRPGREDRAVRRARRTRHRRRPRWISSTSAIRCSAPATGRPRRTGGRTSRRTPGGG
ncbi:MAG: sigma factor [Acidimicrobiales bacterium]